MAPCHATSFCTRKHFRFLFMFSIGLTLFAALLLFPLLVTFLCLWTVFKTEVSSSIDPHGNVFLFGYLNVNHKDWLTYFPGTDKLVNFAAIFLSQMTYLRWSILLLRSLAMTLTILLLWIFFFWCKYFCSAVAFLRLRNSDYDAVSVFIDFPLISCYLKLSDKLQKQICRTVGPCLSSLLSFLAQLGSGIIFL